MFWEILYGKLKGFETLILTALPFGPSQAEIEETFFQSFYRAWFYARKTLLTQASN